MKLLKTSFITLVLLNLFLVCTAAQGTNDLPPQLVKALQTGNSITLGNYFSDRIELAIQDKESIYSKSQATQIISKFFREYPPTNFKIKHAGGKPGARYVIGTLYTKSKTFRINFLLKSPNGKPFIHQLHIETDGH
ncbi:MAG: DUF4783 domain-containing protein [Marinifilaceae bacterium]|jgi:hypothetical protein